jgi:hypothetical protein
MIVGVAELSVKVGFAVFHRIGETLRESRKHFALAGRPLAEELAQQSAPCGRDGGSASHGPKGTSSAAAA